MPPGWTPQDWESRDIDLCTLDVPVRLRCWGDDPDQVAARVERAWSAALASSSVAPRVTIDVVVTTNHEVRTSAAAAGALAETSMASMLHLLSTRVTLAVIEQQAGRLWMLHGAALADPRTGASVALVAPSGTGKSTAARALGPRFGYLTDETTGIAPDLALAPHPKPLSFLQAGSPVKDQLAPGEVGLLPAPPTPHLRAVVLLRRDGSRTVGLQQLRTSMALAALAPETSYLTRLERPLAFIAEILDQTVGVFEAHYAEAADLEPAVAELVGR